MIMRYIGVREKEGRGDDGARNQWLIGVNVREYERLMVEATWMQCDDGRGNLLVRANRIDATIETTGQQQGK